MVILVDIDDTLNDFANQYVNYLSKVVGREFNIDLNENTQGRLTPFLLPDHNAMSQTMYRDIVFKKPGFWLGMEVKKDAIKAMEILYSTHDVYIVSKPSPNAINSFSEKAQWVKNNFPFFPLSNLILTNNKSMIVADLIIDDDPLNLDISIASKKAVWDMPYNRDKEYDYRFKSWKEVVDTLV
jgi:5'(3')-deoxyribonucleotidase